MIKECILKLTEKSNLSFTEAYGSMKEIVNGNATQTQMGAFLACLRMKGETVEEITAFAKAMKESCVKISPKVSGRLLDIVGTGGDKIKTFNISTLAAFVASATGIAVAKHCNRAVTGLCGSADLLEKLGVNLYSNPEVVKNTIEQVGLGFMFAPQFHPATRYASKPRRELGVRTVFNILGPLTNPAGANAQLVGVYEPRLVRVVAEVLRNLGCLDAMIVHGIDGLDEISIIGKTMVVRLCDGEITEFDLFPEDFKVAAIKAHELDGFDRCKNARLAFQILRGNSKGAYVDAVLVNAAAAILVGGKADNFSCAMELARKSLESGSAYEKLKQLIRASEGDVSRLEELEREYV